MKTKISGVYKITNTITGDFYIGSSNSIKHRLSNHKCLSEWERQPNNPLYLDFQKYGLENFLFEIVEKTDNLREREQYFIDLLQPTYNSNRANGLDIERKNEYQKEYRQSDEGKDYHKKYSQTEKYKKYNKRYYNQLCLYEGETLTLNILRHRFQKQGIPHPTLEAKKYLLIK